MGCCECCGKCLLIFINAIFMLLSVVFLAVGVIVLAYKSLFQKYINLEEMFTEVLTQVANQSDPSDAVEKMVNDFFAIFTNFGIAMLVLGIFMFVVCILGICGATCVVKCMLIAYVVVVGIVFLGQVIIIALYASGTLDKPIKDKISSQIKKEYKGNEGDNLVSVAINAIQAWSKCCGINDYHDFDTLEKWDKTQDYTYLGVTYSANVLVPVTCCKMNGEFPSGDMTLVDEDCPTIPTDLNSYMNKGCFKAIGDSFQQYKTIAIGVVGGFLAIELILLICAIYLLCNEGSKVNPV